jgi:putative addiction module component (TIGR02574 family)
MSIDQIATEALKLPIRERALLAASLWESIGDPFDQSAIQDVDAVSLAIERDDEIEAGDVKAIPHEDLMRRLRR